MVGVILSLTNSYDEVKQNIMIKLGVYADFLTELLHNDY